MADGRDDPPRTDVRPSATDELVGAIRSWIFAQQLEPGARLGREQDLAERFGVSRPTIREALRVLTSENLVRANKGPGGGIFVAATAEQGIGRTIAQSLNSMLAADAIELEELLETRMLIEVPLAGLAATRASDEDIAILGGILETGTEDPDRMLDADARFHVEIARIAGDRLASALMLWVGEVLQPPLHRAIEPAIVKPVVLQQHWDILRAIERGDPAEAERGMREHLTYLTDLVGAVRRRFFPNGADPSA